MGVSESHGFERVVGAEHVDSCIHEFLPELGAFVFGHIFVNPNPHNLVVLVEPSNVRFTRARRLAVYALAPCIRL